MSYLEHEKHIKEALQDYSPVVDENALWEAVSHSVPKKKRRTPFWIFWTIGAIVIAALTFLLLNKSTNSSHNNIANKNNTLTTDLQINKPNNNSIIKRKSISIDQSTNQNGHPKLVDASSLKRVKNINDNTSKITIPKNQIETDKDTTLSNRSIEITTQPMAVVTNDLQKNDMTTIDVATTNLKQHTASPINSINIDQLLRSVDLLNYERAILPLLDDQVIIPVKGKTTPRWSIGIATGIAQMTSTIQSTNVESQKIADLNNLYTKDLPSFSSSLGLSYQLSNRIRLHTGLQHTLSTQRIKLQEINTTTTLTNGVTQVIIDDSGNENTTISNLNSYSTTEYNTQWHSYLQTYSIPLGLTYDIMRYRKFSLSIGAGIRLDLVHRDRGALLDANYNLYKYKVGGELYDRSLAIGYALHIPINYQLTHRWTLAMRAEYQSFNNKINNDLSLSQHSAGVAIGVQYLLNN